MTPVKYFYIFILIIVLILLQIWGISTNKLIGNEERRGAINFSTKSKSDNDKNDAKRRTFFYDTTGNDHRQSIYPSAHGSGLEGTTGYDTGPGYTYLPPHHYLPPIEHHYYKTPPQPVYHGSDGSLALKGLLIPLAGIALLGAAAALSTNPVLLQLGTLNGKRRKRAALYTHTPILSAYNVDNQKYNTYTNTE